MLMMVMLMVMIMFMFMVMFMGVSGFLFHTVHGDPDMGARNAAFYGIFSG